MSATFNTTVFVVMMSVWGAMAIASFYVALFNRKFLCKCSTNMKASIAAGVVWILFQLVGIYIDWPAGIVAVILMSVLDFTVTKPILRACSKANVEGQPSMGAVFEEIIAQRQNPVDLKEINKILASFPKEVS